MNTEQSVGIHFLCSSRWGRVVIDISAYHHDIRLFLLYNSGQLVEEADLFLAAILVVESVSQMPVACVKYFHGAVALKTGLLA